MIAYKETYDDPDGVVSKLIYEDDEAIAETVVYNYKNRGVICFSVQSGCRVGCSFCGTGKRFIRNLSQEEMQLQIDDGVVDLLGKGVENIQIMSMSMGEPMEEDVWPTLKYVATQYLEFGHHFFVSSVGLSNYEALKDFIMLGKKYPKFGLQFSLHEIDQDKRYKLLGSYRKLLPIKTLCSYGKYWSEETGRKCYFNYICTGKESVRTANILSTLCEGMHVTCSVLCTPGRVGNSNSAHAYALFNKLIKTGLVDVSLFDPAGQDTIGGGCGQLAYSQEKLRGNCYAS